MNIHLCVRDTGDASDAHGACGACGADRRCIKKNGCEGDAGEAEGTVSGCDGAICAALQQQSKGARGAIGAGDACQTCM